VINTPLTFRDINYARYVESDIALQRRAFSQNVKCNRRTHARAGRSGNDVPNLGVEATTMSKTVLIVEDNELNMKLFNDLLQAHGYTTVQARDGKDVLKLAREHRPDLILMDIQLPEISGLEVTRLIKQDSELKLIPVIAVTAFAMKGDEEKIRQGGCEAYIAKPISVTHFLQTVQRFLN
jgi:two-component system, cell cycle response regulator DivK